ncbi:MAG: substrate-binding domain-containing protein, partial [Streptosporangiales bacterium]
VRALRRAGLHSGQLQVIETTALNVPAGKLAGVAIAETPAALRPTAVFCANDLLALGVLQEMTARRIRVPDGISIVGYDDIDFAAAAAVPLSSVRQPRHQLGRTAAQLLLEEALGEASHQHRQVVFEPELVIRQSSLARRQDRQRQDRPRKAPPAKAPAATAPAAVTEATG